MAPRALTLLFTLTLFAGSVLLFLLEPLFGRLVLPLLGGAPAVWNTCLLFFQLTLLAGYLYAWASARWLGPRAQVTVHGALLLVACVVLPIRIVPGWPPPSEQNPIPWLLAVLSVSIGLPFLVVSTTAPVLQHWFAGTEHPESRDPYFLYQASNLGSTIGLIGYPVVVEPWLGLRDQGFAWTVGYVVFVVLSILCAVALLRWPLRGGAMPTPPPKAAARGGKGSAARTPGEATPGWRTLGRWTLLAAVPSSLLLGVTTYLSTDVAVVPLLWVIPLLLYLLTFVLAFGRRTLVPLHVQVILFPLFVLPLTVALVLGAAEPAWLIVPLHLAAFTLAALVCHTLLATSRPDVSHLPLFYLCLSVGGAAGGLFNALVAPQLFPVPVEYPLALVAVCLLKPYRDTPAARARINAADLWQPVAVGLLSYALFEVVRRGGSDLTKLEILLSLGVPVFICFVFSPRPVRFGLGVAAILLAGALRPDPFGSLVSVQRSFFGVHRVLEDKPLQLRLLLHGRTLHGVQSLDANKAREPLAYYTRGGPAGQLFGALGHGPGKSIAVVGLGAGALASFGELGQTWTFFEIDPMVVHLARDAGYFSYLRDTSAATTVVVGDARQSLTRWPGTLFDVMVLDAFSSDAVPVHLLTREALQLYLSRLKPGGVLAFHASSRFLRLRPMFASLAADAGLSSLRELDMRSERADRWTGWTPSEWILMARSRNDFGPLATDSRWGPIKDVPSRVWTDDYSNLITLFRWR